MTNATSAQETTRTGAFASLWLMLRQIFALMLRPGSGAEAGALMDTLEIRAARAILARALSLKPGNTLTVDDFEITRLWNAAGAFEPEFQLKPHLRVVQGAAYRQHLRDLRHVRLVRQMLGWIATLRGLRGRLRQKPGVSLVHRLRAGLHACVHSPDQAAPRPPIPP